jgi:protein-tyrosine phosphatase
MIVRHILNMALVPCDKIPVFNHIFKNLFLGDIVSATNDKCLQNIDIVVDVSNVQYPEKIVEGHSIQYHHISIEDNREVDISCYFNKFVNIVNDAQHANKNVLVHCVNGVSRSVTLVLCFLMGNNMSLKDALIFLKSKRTQYSKPNIGFFKQLLSFEKEMYGTNSITYSECIKML